MKMGSSACGDFIGQKFSMPQVSTMGIGLFVYSVSRNKKYRFAV